ncbi:hypothetical protein AusDCA_2517 [Desulfitobacterium sp. AusDCA]
MKIQYVGNSDILELMGKSIIQSFINPTMYVFNL